MEGIVHQLLGWRSYIFSIRFHCITGAFWTSEANLFLETYIVVSFRVRASFLGGSSQITKWWSFPMAGFLSPQTGCGVSLTNSWLAIGPAGFSQEALTLLKSMFRSNALQPSITTLNEALTACERGERNCGGKIFFFSGEFSLERRVAEASWAGRFFFWGGRVLNKNDSLV